MAADVVECSTLARRVALRLTGALTDETLSEAGAKQEDLTTNPGVTVDASAGGDVMVHCSETSFPLWQSLKVNILFLSLHHSCRWIKKVRYAVLAQNYQR